MESPLVNSGVDSIGFFELPPLANRTEVHVHVHVIPVYTLSAV